MDVWDPCFCFGFQLKSVGDGRQFPCYVSYFETIPVEGREKGKGEERVVHKTRRKRESHHKPSYRTFFEQRELFLKVIVSECRKLLTRLQGRVYLQSE